MGRSALTLAPVVVAVVWLWRRLEFVQRPDTALGKPSCGRFPTCPTRGAVLLYPGKPTNTFSGVEEQAWKRFVIPRASPSYGTENQHDHLVWLCWGLELGPGLVGIGGAPSARRSGRTSVLKLLLVFRGLIMEYQPVTFLREFSRTRVAGATCCQVKMGGYSDEGEVCNA